APGPRQGRGPPEGGPPRRGERRDADARQEAPRREGAPHEGDQRPRRGRGALQGGAEGGRGRHALSAAVTQRLYLEDARHKTALATVTAHAAGGFTPDRTVFHAADARYHPLHPHDR